MIRIGSRHHHLVSDDIAFNRRIQSYLSDMTFKQFIGIGIHRECHSLPHFHLPYIRLIHIAYHLHIVKICYCI